MAGIELVPGQKYKFEFRHSNPFEHFNNPIFGNTQSHYNLGQPIGYHNALFFLDGYFIGEYQGSYAFFVKKFIEQNPNAAPDEDPVFVTDERIVFIPANPVLIQRKLQEPEYPAQLIARLDELLTGQFAPRIVPGSDFKIDFTKLLKILNMRKKVATRKLKPFITHVLSKPPETFTFVNTTTGENVEHRFSGGPYYKRAKAAYESMAPPGNGAARRRSRRSRRRSTRRNRK